MGPRIGVQPGPAIRKTVNSLVNEGPAVTAAKIRWNVREQFNDRRASSRMDTSRALVDARLTAPLPLWPNHIVVFTDRAASLRGVRRLEQLSTCAEASRVGLTVSHLTDSTEARTLVHSSAAVIFFDLAHSGRVDRIAEVARAKGIPTLYFASAPRFSEDITTRRGVFLGLTARELAQARSSARSHLRTLSLADHGVAATDELGALMEGHVKGRVFVLPYDVDPGLSAILRGIGRLGDPRDDEGTLIGYESLSLGWDPDLESLAPTLRLLLEEDPSVTLVIAGACRLPEELSGLGKQVEVSGNITLGERMLLLAGTQLVIGPDSKIPGGHFLDDLQSVHAGALGMPMISGRSGDATGELTGCRVANTPSDWTTALRELIYDPSSRRRMAESLRQRLPEPNGTEAVARFLSLLEETR